MNVTRSRAAAADVVLLLTLAAAAWLLYVSAARLWWTHDDLYHLHLILGNPRAWYFWDRAVYQAPPPKMLTPLLFLSLDADRYLFGLRPAAFHLHQLVSLCLAPPALYAVLRLWLGRTWSAVGAFLFLLGPPVASIALMIMVRHYVEVIPVAALSVGLWVLALQRPERGPRGALLATASALVWFLAALEKETAVPLALFLLLIPEGTLRERLWRWLPHAVALLVYSAIRVFFLGSPKGYGFVVQPGDWPYLILTLPAKVAAEMRGLPTAASWTLLAAVLVGLVLAACRGREGALRVGAALALTLAPVLPVSTQMEPRYAVAAWLVAAMAFPFACQGLAERKGMRRTAAALAIAACVAGLVANREDWAVRSADSVRRSREALAFLALAPGDLLRRPLGVPGELGELRWWKEDVAGLPRGSAWFFDDLYLCLHSPASPGMGGSGRIWGWDEGSQRVVDLTPRLPAIRRIACDTSHDRAPLRAEIRGESTGITWELGPYRDGDYKFVLGDGAMAVEMPRTGGFLLRQPAPLTLRVKYESPDGWVTYSPPLAVDPARRSVLRWQR
jgi:hypothetical protein